MIGAVRLWMILAVLLLAGMRVADAGVHDAKFLRAGVMGHIGAMAAQMVATPDEPAFRDWRGQLHGLLGQPDVDVSLLIVGLLLIYLELNVPGVVLPGALGLLCVLLGLYGLWAFPLSGAAALFLLVGVVLFPLEAKLGGHGGLAVVGTAMLVYGLAHLVIGSASSPGVHLGTAIAAGVSFGGITAVLGVAAAKARRGKRLMGEEALLGARAVVRRELAPIGQVEVRGELWQARGEDGVWLPAGAEVVVRGRQDLLLLVGLEAGGEAKQSGAASRLKEV